MSGKFHAAYSALTDFIASRPEIEISESVIGIPETVRPEFYNLFNNSRKAFVKERYSDFLKAAEMLLEHYREAEEKTAGVLSFEDSATVSPVRRFLRDPMDSLTRQLFDLLFDLLKARETLASFEEKGVAAIDSVASDLYRAGYERWVVLSLVSMLTPDEALRVDARRLNPGEKSKSMLYSPVDSVPAPVPSATFLFDQPREAVFSVPDFIVHSRVLKQYVGIRSEFKAALYHAQNRSQEREWYPVETGLLLALQSGLTLIYTAAEAQDVALVADVGKFCRPDMVLWCVQASTLNRAGALEKISLIHDRMKPMKGSFLIADESRPEQPGKPGSEGVHCITAGFEPLMLQPIIEALAETLGTT
jgi:hypothetical protein